ncbi:MAG: hypothetical protein KO202_04550 [Methanobacteriaceae archaeon]|jgi:hypothetical protein|nr:hypothetical protein [Methanobacteriaceae archaeon]
MNKLIKIFLFISSFLLSITCISANDDESILENTEYIDELNKENIEILMATEEKEIIHDDHKPKRKCRLCK